MKKLRIKIEQGFEKLAGLIYENRIKTLLVLLAIVAGFSSQLPKLTFDMSVKGWLHENDPARITYENFQSQFGREDVLIIGITPPDIFEPNFLKKLTALHEELEEKVPYIEDINSLVNARNTRGEKDRLIVEELLENPPQTEDDMAALKERVMANPMYNNVLISGDGKVAAIIIQFDSRIKIQETEFLDGFESDNAEKSFEKNPSSEFDDEFPTLSNEDCRTVILAANKVLEKYKSDEFIVYVTGGPALVHYMMKGFTEDLRNFMILALVVIALFLFIMFRRISGVFLPFIVVLTSLAATLGLMAIIKVPFTPATQILPSFLLAVGVGGAVHILAIFYFQFQQNTSKKDAIIRAMGHSGMPVVMTNITTACGLFSFSTAELTPISEFGLVAAIGVMLALCFTVLLLPAMIALFPIRKNPMIKTAKKGSAMEVFLSMVSRFATDNYIAVLIVSFFVVAGSVYFASKIQFSHDPINWFPEDSYIRITTEKLDRDLKGTINLEIIVDTQKENGFYDPDILSRLDEAAQYLEALQYQDVPGTKTLSLSMVIKEINQALNENNPASFTIPKGRELIAQELLLFENSGADDLEDFTDGSFSKARLTVKLPFLDSVKCNDYLNFVGRYLDKQFPDEKVSITGQSAMIAKTNVAAIRSMTKSYIYAFGVITVLMVILIGNIRSGLLSMIPNIFPIILMLGLMGIFSLKMSVFSMMVGSIAIGLAVDDTIHFMHNFRRYYDETGDPKEAVHLTLQSTGRAMLVTTIVLSMGFFIYMFATMQSTFDFGMLTGFAVSMALVADFLLAPALMILSNKTIKKETSTLSHSQVSYLERN